MGEIVSLRSKNINQDEKWDSAWYNIIANQVIVGQLKLLSHLDMQIMNVKHFDPPPILEDPL